MKQQIFCLLVTFFVYHSSAILSSNNDCTNIGCKRNHIKMSRIIGNRGGGDIENVVRISLIGDYKKAHCAGAIQNALYIITAAHCITDVQPSELVVTAGEFKPYAQNRSVISFESHPDWDAYTFLNDIALLKLNESLVLSYGHVFPLELGKQNKMNWTVKIAWITGWGLANGFGKNLTYPRLFRIVSVPLVDQETCKTIYHKIGKHVNENQMCAGGEKHFGPCTGDGGAPLSFTVLYSSKIQQHYTIGIFSTYEGCTTEVPGIYTDLEKYDDWIQSKAGRQCDYNVNEIDSANKKRKLYPNAISTPKTRIDENVAKAICKSFYQFAQTGNIQGPLIKLAMFPALTLQQNQIINSNVCINWQWNTCVGCQKFIPVRCQGINNNLLFNEQNHKMTPRLVGGYDADPNQLQYQVKVVFVIQDQGFLFACGGVIYNVLHVLTSARCVRRKIACEIKVIAGDEPTRTMQIRQVVSLLVHEHYVYDDNQNNDIALLRLDSPFNFTKYVHSILLATQEYPTADVKFAEVSSWRQHSLEYPETYVLEIVKIPILDNCDCKLIYSHQSFNQFSSYKVCAGMVGQGFCSNDFGNPLTIQEGGNKYLLGIASYSRTCGIFAGLATKVLAYREWIVMRAGNQ